MKTRHGLFIGFAVLIIAAIFTFAGCPSSSDDDSIVGIWQQGSYILEFTATEVRMGAGGTDGVFPYTFSGTALTVDGSSIGQGIMTATAIVSGSTLTISGFPAGGPNGTWIRQ
jgi:hypothetical protein